MTDAPFKIILEIEVMEVDADLTSVWEEVREALPTTIKRGNVSMWLNSDEYLEAERERLRQQIIPLLRTSGVKNPSLCTPSDFDTGFDMALDTVLDLLGWGNHE